MYQIPNKSQDLITNSTYCLPNDSHYVSLENLVSDQLVIPKLIFSLFSLLICMILYRYSKEKFCLGHLWELGLTETLTSRRLNLVLALVSFSTRAK